MYPVSGSPAGSTHSTPAVCSRCWNYVVTCSRADLRAHQSQCGSVLHIGSEIGKNGNGTIPKAYLCMDGTRSRNSSQSDNGRHFKTETPVTPQRRMWWRLHHFTTCIDFIVIFKKVWQRVWVWFWYERETNIINLVQWSTQNRVLETIFNYDKS